MVAVVVAGVLGACGTGDSSSSTTSTTAAATSTSPPQPTTTAYWDHPCFKFPVEVLKLQNDYREELRGIVPPDEALYRQRAQALLDESRRLGCSDPAGLKSFLD